MKNTVFAALAASAGLAVSAAVPADYAKKLTMTVNPARAGYDSGDVADIPVAVRLSAASIPGFSYDDFREEGGGDLLFTDESGSVLAHEIESWNVDGESVVWVKMPQFGPGRRLYAYYGGEAVEQDPTAVWSGYTGVWHMSEESGTVADATGNGLGAEPQGVDTTQMKSEAGSVGVSRFLAGSGKSYLSISGYGQYIDSADSFSFSGWFKAKSVNGWSRFVSNKVAYDKPGWEVEARDGSFDKIDVRGDYGADWATIANLDEIPSVLGEWVHFTWVFSKYDAFMYINGVEVRVGRTDEWTGTHWVQPVTNKENPLSIGNNSNGSEANFLGWVDECRLSGGAKSAERIAAEYAAQTSDALLYSVSANDAGYASVALANFTKRFTVTATGYTADEAFSDFPMLVRLNPEAIDGFSYGDFVQSDYSDIAFFDADGSALAFDVDTWNTDGESLVWVKVPSFTKDTSITVAYGGLVKNDIHQKATWSGYRGVWHLNETGDGVQSISDATANGIDGASHAATEYVADGAIGGSRRMATKRGASDANGGVRFPFNAAMNVSGSDFYLVASTWVNLDTTGNWGGALFMRKNAMDDGGWGFAYDYTQMHHFDFYYRESLDGIYTPWSGDAGGYTKYFSEKSIWYIEFAKGEWHKFTFRFHQSSDGVLRCAMYVDGERKGEESMLNYLADEDGNSTGEASYAPLCQPTDKGLALGAFIGSGNYPLLGAMDEARIRSGTTSSTREALEFAQESDADYWSYSLVSDIEDSSVPGVVAFGEAGDAAVANDSDNGKVVFTIPVNVSSLRGGAATLRLLVGVAEPKDGDPAERLAEVATMDVSAAGDYSFTWDGAVLGTKVAYKVVSVTQIDESHSFTSETAVKTATLTDTAEYRWVRNAKGLWSDKANWTRTSSDDGLPRLGYPSYGSRFNIYGDSQKSEIQVDANYEGLESGSTLGWGGDDITFKGVVKGAAIGYPTGSGFKDGQYSNVKVTLDGVSLVCGSYRIHSNSSLTMRNGAYLYTYWDIFVRGDNATLFVGDGCEIEQYGAANHRFEFSGENASITIDNGTVKASIFRISGENDTDASFEGKAQKGIFFKGAAPQLQIKQFAKIHADTGAELPVVFTIPETGYAAAPIVKTDAEARNFAERNSGVAHGVRVSIDRDSPFFSQDGRVKLSQTLIDWTAGGKIESDAVSFTSNVKAAFRYEPEDAEAKTSLAVELASKAGFSVVIR